jgi:alpha-glucosidase (family GH31 glycosyl hydrolase)
MDAISTPILFHDPGGRQHPYEAGPYERVPYHPQAGQAIILNFVTQPAGQFEQVQAEWRCNEDTHFKMAPAAWLKNEGDESHWQAQLPAQQGSETIEYRLVGKVGSETLSTPDFSFYVSTWAPVIGTSNPAVLRNAARVEYHLSGRADTLPLTITFVENQVIQLEWGEASFDTSAAVPVEMTHFEDGVVFTSGELQVSISFAGVLQFQRQGNVVLEEVQAPSFLIGAGGELLQIRQSFKSSADEGFYGFGERYNSLDQRGNRIDVRVYEQYKQQGTRTYLPVPFFISSKPYGWFLDSSRYAEFDLAADVMDQWSYQAELGSEGRLTTCLFAAPEPKEILKAFVQRTGQPVLPPAWAFGLWVSSNDWDNQAVVLEQIRLAKEYDIPATVLVIEAWSDEINFYIWNDAKYKPVSPEKSFRLSDFTFPADGRWPDPQGMIDALHDAGMRLILWQIPVLKRPQESDIGPFRQHDADEALMIEKRYCIMNPDGTPYRVRPPWFRGSLLMDFTSEEGSQWWFNKRRYLLAEMGVDGFKTDGGEHLWSREAVFSNGGTGEELWNLYPNQYQEGYTRFIRQHRGNDAVLFSRAGFTGAQKAPMHWAGDENSTWQAYQDAITAMLNAGLSGIPFIGWDLAGFSGDIPDAELYLRSAAMAAFCPIMQYHSEYHRKQPSRDRTPWNIQACTGDERVLTVFRYFANLRMNLLPYILHEAGEASRSGLPLMRPLFLEFSGDSTARQFPYQYLFGSSMLVAPVIQPGLERTKVYLPAGTWYDFWTNQTFEGPVVLEVSCPLERIPVFILAGSQLPLNLNERFELGGSIGNEIDQYNQYCLKVFPEAANSEGSTVIHLPPQPRGVTVIVPSERPARVSGDGISEWEYDEAAKEMRIFIAASGFAQTIHLYCV